MVSHLLASLSILMWMCMHVKAVPLVTAMGRLYDCSIYLSLSLLIKFVMHAQSHHNVNLRHRMWIWGTACESEARNVNLRLRMLIWSAECESEVWNVNLRHRKLFYLWQDISHNISTKILVSSFSHHSSLIWSSITTLRIHVGSREFVSSLEVQCHCAIARVWHRLFWPFRAESRSWS